VPWNGWVWRTAAATWSRHFPAALRRRVEIAKGAVALAAGAADGRGLHRPRPRGAPRPFPPHREPALGEGVTILLTTHILEEASRCDRLVLLHEGSMVA